MKKPAIKMYLQLKQGKKVAAKRTLVAQRAKIRLPYKPEHVTEEAIREAVAQLG